MPPVVAIYVIYVVGVTFSGDVVSILAVLAGIAGAISGTGAVIAQRRDVTTKEAGGYVERNLAAMQAIIDLQDNELDGLRERLAASEKALDECLRRRTTSAGSSSSSAPRRSRRS